MTVQPLTGLDRNFLEQLPNEHTCHGVPLHRVANCVFEEMRFLSGHRIGDADTPLLEARVPLDSCGIAIGNTEYAGRYYEVADDPTELSGCLIGDPRLGLNALRMLRSLAWLSDDLADGGRPRFRTTGEIPVSLLRDPVGSAVTSEGLDNDFRWGDYGTPELGVHPGGVSAGQRQSQVLVAVSLYHGWQNTAVAAAIAELCAGLVNKALAA